MKGIARVRILRTGHIREAEIHWYEPHGEGRRDFKQEAAQMNTFEHPTAVVCVQNEGNEVSLQLWKIYKPLRDDDVRSEGFLRVIDESGEDYLFPEENVVPIELPMKVKKPFERAIREQRRAASTPHISASVKRVGANAAKKPKRPGRLTSR